MPRPAKSRATAHEARSTRHEARPAQRNLCRPQGIIRSPMPNHLDAVPFSGIIRIRDMMYGVSNPFRLDQGDVSFDAPDTVKQALLRAVHENRSHYVPTTGIPPLLERLTEKLRTKNAIPVGDPREGMVTNGGTHGLYTVCLALLDPGDEVVVPDPAWPPAPGNIPSTARRTDH